ncbi:Hypothetical predicted protein [Lynx pardinus]|uniref:Uncharacterized protein n=1 Tax=Lynx pardinus TaxID=191816 RepID=A0A485N8B6_LYNPA|nr:Hypothetical predicted protein [Lynx pardinus]
MFQNGYGFYGSVIFSHQRRDHPEFGTFLRRVQSSTYPGNIFHKSFWHSAFECSEVGGTTGTIQMIPECFLDMLPLQYFEVTMSAHSYIVYSAVHAVAWALPGMFLIRSEAGSIEGRAPVVSNLWKIRFPLKGNASLRVHLTASGQAEFPPDILVAATHLSIPEFF